MRLRRGLSSLAGVVAVLSAGCMVGCCWLCWYGLLLNGTGPPYSSRILSIFVHLAVVQSRHTRLSSLLSVQLSPIDSHQSPTDVPQCTDAVVLFSSISRGRPLVTHTCYSPLPPLPSQQQLHLWLPITSPFRRLSRPHGCCCVWLGQLRWQLPRCMCLQLRFKYMRLHRSPRLSLPILPPPLRLLTARIHTAILVRRAKQTLHTSC